MVGERWDEGVWLGTYTCFFIRREIPIKILLLRKFWLPAIPLLASVNFLGYSSFTNEEPFSDTLFPKIRERLSIELLSRINEVIALHFIEMEEAKARPKADLLNKKLKKPVVVIGK